MSLTQVSNNLCFGGIHQQFTHHSSSLNCEMRFAIFLPPQAQKQKVPVLYWLSGLTCTDENFMQKAGAQRIAAELGIAIVAPDTSPRGENVPDDPNGSYDFGLGAGFYLNATQAPWAMHYQMYDYVVTELPALIEASFPVNEKRSISGHSMGGHGALVIGLRNPDRYSSISAFSPICHPSQTPWGIKAFSHYLGENKAHWEDYDATKLISQVKQARPIRIDQGLADQFLEKELQPEHFITAAKAINYPIEYHTHQGYDHSYYFIASFIEEHLRFHTKVLGCVISSTQ